LISDFKNTLKHTAFYSLSRISTKALSFILLPIYTSYFSAETVANINLLESFWQYVFTICLLGLETTMINFCLAEKDISKRKKLVFNFTLILIINCLIVFLIVFPFLDNISNYIFDKDILNIAVFYCILISVFESLLIIPLTISRINDKPNVYSIIIISSLVINLSLQILFIVYLKLGFETIFLAKFIAPVILLLICITYVYRNLKISFDKDVIWKILKFAFPLMLAMFASILLNTFDRFILVNFVNKTQIAIYTIGYSLGSITNFLIITPFTLAINIIFWKKVDDKNLKYFLTKLSTYLFFLIVYLSIIIAFLFPSFISLIIKNSELYDVTKIIPLILLSNAFLLLFGFTSLDFYYKRKTQFIFYIILICLIVNIVTNFIFIPIWGILASAGISIVSNFLMAMLGYLYLRKNTFTIFEEKKLLLLIGLFFLYLFFYYWQDGYLNLPVMIGLLIFFPLILFFTKYFEMNEIRSLKNFIFKKIK
jgi:O-antigen/teichoic acid export membrane protein